MKFILLTIYTFLAFNTTAQKVFIETELSRTLYCGIDNSISIWVEGYNTQELSYTVDAGEIISIDKSGRLVWRICSSNILRAKLIISSRKKIIQEIIFLVRKIPPPSISIPGKDHRFPFSSFLWHGIRADIQSFIVEGIMCEVVSYDVNMTFKDSNDTIKFINKGAFLNKENIPYFNKLKPGDTVYVYNVEVKVGCATQTYLINEVFKRVIY